MKEGLPLSSKSLDIIYKYIDKLCIKMDESPEEVEDFRQEMVTNLKSSVMEWISRGFTESDAVHKALSNFGEHDQIESELTGVYRTKKVYSGRILKLSLLLLMLGSIIIGLFFVWNEVYQYKAATDVFNIVRQEMGTVNEPVSKEMKNKLHQEVESRISTTAVVLRIHDKGKAPQEYPVEDVYPLNTKLDYLNNIPSEENFFTYVVSGGTSISISGTEKFISIDIGIRLFSDMTLMLGVSLLLGYWILFAAWASKNVFYKRHGKALWMIVFLLFNVLGYGFYSFTAAMNKRGLKLNYT